jgi:L-ascorbate metabolism protein UlaG (beta-lactamase superfamily)
LTTLTFLGHAAFLLEADGKTVAVDPFLSGNPRASHAADDIQPETILLTHAHADHLGDTVPIANRTGATVIANAEISHWLESQGVEGAIPANHGGTVAFDGGTVKLVPAWHTSSFRSGEDLIAAGVPSGLVVRFGGKTVYFAGDTCLFSDMKLIGEEGLDVAVLPIGDHFTMGPADAARAAGWLQAKTVIPCHYDTFPPIRQDAAEFKRLVEQHPNTTCVVLEPGATLDL